MTNHIHFLATPQHSSSLSNTIKVVGSRYAYHINKYYGHTGTLWEGRHKSSLAHNSRNLLSCCHYIELNPVRAGMVISPEEYGWSSYGCNAWGDVSWITPHEDYLKLAEDHSQRLRAYRRLFENQLEQQV